MRQPCVVAHYLELAQLGQSGRSGAQGDAWEQRGQVVRRHSDCG
jgi:hypothetical protein